MNMLTKYQLELIHREIDGENTPEASAEVRELVATQPEAAAFMTNLQSLDAMFRQVPYREPPPGARHAIYRAMLSPGAGHAQGTTQTITRWAAQQWNGVSTFMGELMLTKKVLLVATTAVAVIAIIGNALVGYPPSVFDAGTIGSGDGISGVEKAGRYHGAKKTDADVTLTTPEVQALLQNDQVLKLVKSDAFREVMHNDAYRVLMSSDQYRLLLQNDAFLALMSSDQYRLLLQNDAFRALMSSEAFRVLMSNAAYQELMAKAAYSELASNAAFQEIMSNEAFRAVLQNDAFRQIMSNESYRQIMSSESYRQIMSNDSYRLLMANDSYRQIMSNESYRLLMESDAFRAIARSQSLSEAFLNEAMRVQF